MRPQSRPHSTSVVHPFHLIFSCAPRSLASRRPQTAASQRVIPRPLTLFSCVSVIHYPPVSRIESGTFKKSSRSPSKMSLASMPFDSRSSRTHASGANPPRSSFVQEPISRSRGYT
jgi:hypothetical protein